MFLHHFQIFFINWFYQLIDSFYQFINSFFQSINCNKQSKLSLTLPKWRMFHWVIGGSYTSPVEHVPVTQLSVFHWAYGTYSTNLAEHLSTGFSYAIQSRWGFSLTFFIGLFEYCGRESHVFESFLTKKVVVLKECVTFAVKTNNMARFSNTSLLNLLALRLTGSEVRKVRVCLYA